MGEGLHPPPSFYLLLKVRILEVNDFVIPLFVGGKVILILFNTPLFIQLFNDFLCILLTLDKESSLGVGTLVKPNEEGGILVGGFSGVVHIFILSNDMRFT